MNVRVVRLLGADDPVEEDDPEEAKRIRQAEAQARYRERHPDRVKAQNAEQYKKHRTQRLADKKAARVGPGREEFLDRARKNNRRYREKDPEKIRRLANARYARNRVQIVVGLRAERRVGNEAYFARFHPKFLERQQRNAVRNNAARGGRVFKPVPITTRGGR